MKTKRIKPPTRPASDGRWVTSSLDETKAKMAEMTEKLNTAVAEQRQRETKELRACRQYSRLMHDMLVAEREDLQARIKVINVRLGFIPAEPDGAVMAQREWNTTEAAR